MPKPDAKPIGCSEAGYMRQGDKCVAVECELYADNPCSEYIKPGNPNSVEEIIPVEEELLVEEELGENTDDSEGDEDSGSDDREGSEDSGGSQNEVEDEGSEEESGGGN